MADAKYKKIGNEIKKRIRSGEYHGKLPSEINLAKDFATAPLTIRRALESLAEEKLIRKVPHVGNFVESSQKIPLRIGWGSCFKAEETELLLETLCNEFPRLELTLCGREENSPPPDVKLIPATTDICYSLFAAPIPLERIRYYTQNNYTEAPFEVHRVNNFCYALPILYSPVLLKFHCGRLRGFGEEIRAFRWEMLPALAEFARKKQCGVCHFSNLFMFFRYLIFSASPTGFLKDADPEAVRKNIAHLFPLMDSDLLTDRVDARIMSTACRQNLRSENDGKESLLVEFPEPPFGNARIPVAGEFALVCSRTRHPEEAGKVAEYLLSPSVQEILSRNGIGIPVLKSAAFDSMRPEEADDMLFFRKKNALLCNNAAEQEFIRRLSVRLRECVTHRVGVRDFSDFIDQELLLAASPDTQKYHPFDE